MIEPPICRHRGEAVGREHLCRSPRLPAPATVDCRLCQEPDHAGKSRHAPFERRSLPCIYLGPPTGEAKDCHLCGGGKQIPLRACAVHGVCTDERLLVYRDNGSEVRVAWCRTCADYAALTPDS